ncbi:MAG TPA: heavy-metal-associated domain-containing protein, partial [Allosphingosinicella sp.]
MKLSRRLPFAFALLATALAGGAVYAQLEGADRGVPPIDSASTFEITGVAVDTGGNTAAEAREAGWRQAQRRGWKALWAKTNNRPLSEAPDLPE